MGASQHVLIVSSDDTFASELERELGASFVVHAAATDTAAFVLLDAYSYACVVADVSAQSLAGSATISSLHLNALTVPIVTAREPGPDSGVPDGIAITHCGESVAEIARAVRKVTRSDS